jgi:putative transposase
MRRTFEYRIFPSVGQGVVLEGILETQRQLYNAALQERREDFRRAKESAARADDGSKPEPSVSLSTQEKAVKAIKDGDPELDAIHTHVFHATLRRLEDAYRGFFRRVKAGKKPGYPRFKGFGRFRSFTFKEAGNGVKLLGKDDPVRSPKGAGRQPFPSLPDAEEPEFKLVAAGKRLYLHGVGKVKIKLHRPFEGKVKQVRVIKKQGHWFAQMSCDEVPRKPLPPTGRSVGIDLGITTFAALSDGHDVPNPRIAERDQPAIAKAQRKVSRRKRGSKRRHKAVALLSKRHGRLAATRQTFHHTVAKDLLEKYDVIAIEDLNIRGLSRGFLAKFVHDVGWGQFVQILSDKAESAGREVVKVEAAGTSQECSGCGSYVRKGLHVRTHRCPTCGMVLDRDTNAARNILKKAGAQPSGRVQ